MEPDLTDEELREITQRKREATRLGRWGPEKVRDVVGRVLSEEKGDYEAWKRSRDKVRQWARRRKAREEREKQRKARGRGKGKNKRELPKSKYIIIPNEFIEAVYKQSFGANQHKVLLFVLRKTWGWQKRSEFIRVTDIANELKIPKSRVSEALSSLKKRRIVTVERNKTYAIQTDISLWRDLYRKP